jgi:hypothetical protein
MAEQWAWAAEQRAWCATSRWRGEEGDLDELRRVVCRGVERARRCRRRARGSVVVERDDARCDWRRQDARARWVAVSVDSRVSDVRAIVK